MDKSWRKPNSWRKLNSHLHSALGLAIRARLSFRPSDIQDIRTNMRGEYWMGDNTEWIYELSVTFGNLSAAASYEEYKHRKPFMLDGVRLYDGRSLPLELFPEAEELSARSAVVTSLQDDSVVVCCYRNPPPTELFCSVGGKPLKIIKLTREQLKVMDRGLREKKKLEAERLSESSDVAAS
jgi:hypothetical protein